MSLRHGQIPEDVIRWTELQRRRRIRSGNAAGIGSAELRPRSVLREGHAPQSDSDDDYQERSHCRIVPYSEKNLFMRRGDAKKTYFPRFEQGAWGPVQGMEYELRTAGNSLQYRSGPVLACRNAFR